MGPVPPADPNATPRVSNVGPSTHPFGSDSGNRWQQQLAPVNGEGPNLNAQNLAEIGNVTVAASKIVSEKGTENVEVPLDRQVAPKIKSVVIGPSKVQGNTHISDPLIPMIPSLIKKVILFIHMNPHFQIFKNVTNLVVDHNTLIPSYISDTPLLIHLAFILLPQLGDNALEKIALEYLEDEETDEEPEEEPEMTVAVNTDDDIVMEEKEDSDVEMLDGPPLGFTTSKKKKTLKVKEKLDDEFLRRSKRVFQNLGGFKNEESAKKHREEEKGNKTPRRAQKNKKTKAPKKGKKLEVGTNVLEEEPTVDGP